MTEAPEAPLLQTVRRRRHKRYGQNGSITLRRSDTELLFAGDLFDISIGGCLIWMETPTRFLTSDRVELKLKTGSLSLRVFGSVRYASASGRILGVEYQRLSLVESVALDHFIRELEAAAAREADLFRY